MSCASFQDIRESGRAPAAGASEGVGLKKFDCKRHESAMTGDGSLRGPKSMFPGVVERLVTRFRLDTMCTSIIRRLLSPACRVVGTRRGAASRRTGGKTRFFGGFSENFTNYGCMTLRFGKLLLACPNQPIINKIKFR